MTVKDLCKVLNEYTTITIYDGVHSTPIYNNTKHHIPKELYYEQVSYVASAYTFHIHITLK